MSTPPAPRDPQGTDRTVTVSTPALRRALKAVMPHHEKRTAEEHHVLHRVRLVIDAPASNPDDADHVMLRVLAANGETTATALVQVLDDTQAGAFQVGGQRLVVDLLPHDVRGVISLFGVAPKTDIVEGDERTDIRVTTDSVRFTDSGGLFSGQHLQFPQLPKAGQFPDVEEIARRALADGTGPANGATRPLYAAGTMLALFSAAGAAYEQPLLVEPVGPERKRGWLVTCGARFVGTASGEIDSENSVSRRTAYRTRLLEAFGLAERELADA